MEYSYFNTFKNTRLVVFSPHPDLEPFIKKYEFRINSHENMHDCPMVPIQNGMCHIFMYINSSHIHININKTKGIFSTGLIGLFDPGSSILLKPQIPDDCIHWVNITFSYAGLCKVLSIQGDEIFNKVVSLPDILGNSAILLQEELHDAGTDVNRKIILDRYFLKRFCKSTYHKEPKLLILDDIFKKTIGLLTVEMLSDELCMSYRSVERFFEIDVGLNFRNFMKIYRINKVLKLMRKSENIDLFDIVYQCGYYDQAHFINDFKKFTGYSPRKFLNLTHGNYFLNMPYVILDKLHSDDKQHLLKIDGSDE